MKIWIDDVLVVSEEFEQDALFEELVEERNRAGEVVPDYEAATLLGVIALFMLKKAADLAIDRVVTHKARKRSADAAREEQARDDRRDELLEAIYEQLRAARDEPKEDELEKLAAAVARAGATMTIRLETPDEVALERAIKAKMAASGEVSVERD